MFTGRQHNSNHHIPANSDGLCHRVRQARALVAVPGRASNRRDRLGPRLPALSRVYHRPPVSAAAPDLLALQLFAPVGLAGRGPRARTRTKDRASRTSVQSQSMLQGCQTRAVRRHLGRTTTRNRESQSHVHIFLVVRPHPQATVVTTAMVAPHLHRTRPKWGGDPDSHLRAHRAQPQLRDAVASQTLENDRFQGATGTKTVAERRRGSSCACPVTGTARFGRSATRRTEPDQIAEQFWHRISDLTLGG